MNPVLVRAVSVGRRVVEQAVKRFSSGSWNGKERSTPRSSQMPPKNSDRLRSEARQPWKHHPPGRLERLQWAVGAGGVIGEPWVEEGVDGGQTSRQMISHGHCHQSRAQVQLQEAGLASPGGDQEFVIVRKDSVGTAVSPCRSRIYEQ